MSYPLVPLSQILEQNTAYIGSPEPRIYPKLSVRLYGRGVELDTPADGSTILMTRHQLAKAGQVILSEIWGKKGAIGLVPLEGEGALVTSHFFLFDIRRDRAEPRFIEWLLRGNYLQSQLEDEARGTTGYAAVRPKHLLSSLIPLPLLAEQRRIVQRIAALAAKIEEARGLRQQAMEEANNFPVSVHLHLAGQRYVRLAEILSLDERHEPVRPDVDYPQVGVRGFGGGLFAKGSVQGSHTTYRFFNRLYTGAVVLSQVKGWEGAIAVCGPDVAGRYVSPEYRTFRCIPGMAEPRYLGPLLTAPWFWEHLATATRGMGGRRERTRPEQFLELILPMPTLEAQRPALPALAKLTALRRLQEETAAELAAMLPAVLERAFRGEL